MKPLNELLTDDQKPGISIICAVKNRDQPLAYTLPTWLHQDNVRQVIIVDWNSSKPVWESLRERQVPGFPDPRICFVQATAQEQWCLSKAFNLAAMFVSYDRLLKIDSDVACVDPLPNHRACAEQSFLTGNWEAARNPNEVYLNGTALFATQDFLAVGGYDERFKHYGWDDDNLYQRLENQGLKRRFFETGAWFHLPHSDKLRTLHQTVGDTTPANLINVSRLESETWPVWDLNTKHASYHFELDSTAPYQVVVANEVSATESFDCG